MTVHGGARIPTDDLILSVDPGNLRSFKGEPTENLVTNPQFTSTSNWALVTNGGGVFSVSGGYGKIAAGTPGTYNYLYQSKTIAIPPNTIATWSAYFKNDRVATFGIRLVLFGGAAVPAQPLSFVVLNGKGGLVRQTVSASSTGTTTSARLDILSGSYYSGISNADVEFTDAQFELLSYTSPFVNGTRGATVATGGGWNDLSLSSNDFEFINPFVYEPSTRSLVVTGAANNRFVSSLETFGNETTWEAWVYCTSNYSSHNMFMGRYLPYFGFYSGNSLKFSNNISGTQRTVNSPANLELNTWYHTMFSTSYNGSETTMDIYINGVLEATATYTGNQINYGSSYQFTVGDGQHNSWYPFAGKISSIRVYNRCLPATEILQSFNAQRSRYGI